MATINLRDACRFAVLAGTTVTNTATPTAVTGGNNGNVGVSPGTVITNFPPGTIAAPGAQHSNDTLAQIAQNDLTTAYIQAAAVPGGVDPTGATGQLGGLILTPGIYKFTFFQITGNLTLNGAGDYLFQSDTTLVTAAASTVTLMGGATANRVFWQVGSSATLGTNSTFNGNVLALTSITVNTTAAVTGKLLARNGAVNLDDNTVAGTTCAVAATTSTITINYTPEFAGCHRICFRKVPDTDFCCYIDNTPSIVGTPKVFVITVGASPCALVDNLECQDCESQTYEGYVQPCCADECSDSNRVEWSVTYDPTVTCHKYLVTCTNALGCPGFTYAPCFGTSDFIEIEEQPLGTSMEICSFSAPTTIPADYTVTTDPLDLDCCGCTTYNVTITSDDVAPSIVTLYYTNCNKTAAILPVIVSSASPFGPVPFCVITGSISYHQESDEIVTIDLIGPCTDPGPSPC